MAETPEISQQPAATDVETKRRAKLIGEVSSTGGDKTIRVVIDNLVKHQQYGKFIHRRTKLAVHDPQNAAKLGDTVEIVPCRRISKSKSWRLARILRSGDRIEQPAEVK